ncbi:uncharacterized protein LOC129344153 isoform X2 [Eublepharis macularius]|uniref:Uncharacterized protein LOC129344153 isoform X2 n=1 Tax=Eublepharis macularius TaxID=481883 RepID=A0AA97KE82_EUBMA|nr:uncharacterized protein LOC129344153 isoform X2 [Eublepharis macularius]
MAEWVPSNWREEWAEQAAAAMEEKGLTEHEREAAEETMVPFRLESLFPDRVDLAHTVRRNLTAVVEDIEVDMVEKEFLGERPRTSDTERRMEAVGLAHERIQARRDQFWSPTAGKEEEEEEEEIDLLDGGMSPAAFLTATQRGRPHAPEQLREEPGTSTPRPPSPKRVRAFSRVPSFAQVLGRRRGGGVWLDGQLSEWTQGAWGSRLPW